MSTRGLIDRVKWQLMSCDKCGRDNYTSAPWMSMEQVRMLVLETERLLDEVTELSTALQYVRDYIPKDGETNIDKAMRDIAKAALEGK